LRPGPPIPTLTRSVLLSFAVTVLAAAESHAAVAPVSVFPIPGSHVVSPHAQIAFRGVRPNQLGAITVTGSRSGLHTGRFAADSDGRGASFLPAKPFAARESVTVRTSLNVRRGHNGSFQFVVANPAGAIHAAPLLHPSARVPGDVLRLRSDPSLAPASVSTKRSGRTAAGDIFVAPQQGPLQNGPMILDPSGNLIWFKPLANNVTATDFRAQTYQGKPVLTWWQGYFGAGVGVGEDLILNRAYQAIATVHAANGLSADLHEFKLTPQDTALLTAYYPVYMDASAEGGSKHKIVLDAVAQEIDIPTGLVLFQWDSIDHVALSDGYTPPPESPGSPFDYFHINAIDQDDDGNLVISARNTWAAYKVDHQTAQTIWTLGGKHSSFKMGAGTAFAFQHDVRIRARNDAVVTMFDDGAGPPVAHTQGRGLKLKLDLKRRTATLASQDQHSPALLPFFEGNYEQLAGGGAFVGWGQQPYFTEFDAHGRQIFDGRFVGFDSTYRAYRLPWSGAPASPPSLAATGGKTPTVYASWNGATDVSSWRVLGGATATSLKSVASSRGRGFETAIQLSKAQRYVSVEALSRSGHVLRTSRTLRLNLASRGLRSRLCRGTGEPVHRSPSSPAPSSLCRRGLRLTP
jgi:hypothetical protein